jgi:hypothetical protein
MTSGLYMVLSWCIHLFHFTRKCGRILWCTVFIIIVHQLTVHKVQKIKFFLWILYRFYTWHCPLCQVHCLCETFSGLTVRVGLSFWQIWASCRGGNENPRTRISDCNFVQLLTDPYAIFSPTSFILDKFSGEAVCYPLYRSLSTSLHVDFTFEVLCDLARSACLYLGGLQAILTF